MKLNGQFEFIGVESMNGRQDPSKVFHNVALMQGTDVVKVFVDDATLKMFDGIKRMDRVNCDLKVVVGSQKTYINIDKVVKVQ